MHLLFQHAVAPGSDRSPCDCKQSKKAALARDEAADVEAALLLSLQEQEDAAPDDVAIADAGSDDEHSEAEEEEKKIEPAAAEG